MAKQEYEKVWLSGSGTETVYDNGGSVIDISIKKSELADVPTWKTKKGEEYVSFRVSAKKEKGQFGDTHSISYSVKKGEASGGSKSSGDDFFDEDED